MMRTWSTVANRELMSSAFSTEMGGFIAKGGADAQIVQGLMAITASAVNGLPPEEVACHDPSYVEEMGLSQILTPSRANGFMNMVKKVKDEASSLM